MKNLARRAGVALAAVLALAAGEGRAQPFQVVTDGPDSVWTLDTASGELTWCKSRTPSGPKVLDVFGASAEARPQTPHQSVTSCKVVRAPDTSDPRRARIVGLFDGGYGGYDGYGGYGGYGGGGWGYGGYVLTSGMYGDLYGGSSGTYADIYKARSGTRSFFGYRID